MAIKILTILGTRPEVIKLAPVIHVLDQAKDFDIKVCSTGQHAEMLEAMLALFSLRIDYDLALMKPDQNLFELSVSLLLALRRILIETKPDMVIVQGDTTTAFFSALAAFYEKIPCAHVEAGLRTGDLYAPFPEEANRHLIGVIADLHFAPTAIAKENLLRENISPSSIHITGNTVIDALLWVSARVVWKEAWRQLFSTAVKPLESNAHTILVTGHRRESFGEGFKQICEAIKALAQCYPEWHIIYPVHLNPNVKKPVYKYLDGLANVHLIEPLGYEPFVYLMNHAKIILTDSGGVQEEAPTLGKPVLVMREKTERPEAIMAGTAMLVGVEKKRIVDAVATLIDDPVAYNRMANAVNPYGDGHASQRIVKFIRNYFDKRGKK